MEQSSSPTRASHDQRSLTDLWRDLQEHRDADALGDFWQRMDAVADRYEANQTIREHAQVEHPEVAWDAQATTFVTGRATEGWAR